MNNTCNLTFSSNHIFFLSKDIFEINIKNYCGILHPFIHTKALESSEYFTLTAHLNLDAKCSLSLLDKYLGFQKFTAEKVDSVHQPRAS